jgi:hypothetical protein
VECTDEVNIKVVIHQDLRCVLTAPSMTRMPSLTDTLLVNFIISLDCTFPLSCERQDDIRLINCQ